MYDRLPAPAELSAEQRSVVAEISSGPRGGLVGPFTALLHAPELCRRLASVGEFLRYRSTVADRHVELAVLCVARYWDQQFEWGYHLPIAHSKGVPEATTDALADDREPPHADAEAAAVWRLVTELLDSKRVSDSTYGEVVTLLGEEAAVELAATAGYYSTLAMVMNMAQTPPPVGAGGLPPR